MKMPKKTASKLPPPACKLNTKSKAPVNSPAPPTPSKYYAGKLIDGGQFDSSYDRGQTISFPLNGVIAGWTEGLQLMKEGGKAELTIPANLGYGERGAGGVIPGGATLIFTVELLAVKG